VRRCAAPLRDIGETGAGCGRRPGRDTGRASRHQWGPSPDARTATLGADEQVQRERVGRLPITVQKPCVLCGTLFR
jgi:hypothetical protein